MSQMLGHVGSLLAYAARRGARRRSDHATVEQLAWPASTRLPAGLQLTWLGTAGFRFDYQGHTLLIDPYVTRIPIGRFLRRAVTPPDPAAITRWTDRADAILIGHTHFDHALDAPAIAQATNATVYGSRSLAHLMALSAVPHLAVEVEPYQTYASGPFEFSFIPSLHSKLNLGLSVPMGGELTCEHLDELTPQAYRCGQVWGIHLTVAGVSFYHQGSADLLDDAIRHTQVDYFLCGIAGRRFTRNYLPRILGKLEPRVVIPTHYDDFFRPLTAPLDFSLNVNLTHFADEVREVSSDFTLHALSPGHAV
jgi:L-ascorbate metabolism protein UlaG (beta-lactamase superfamily)